MPNEILPTISCVSSGLAGWNLPRAASRNSRSSSLFLNMPKPPDRSSARVRHAEGRFNDLVLHREDLDEPVSADAPFRPIGFATASMCGPIASMAIVISAIPCCTSGW